MKIAVAGTGYVGLSLAVLLSQHNEVTAVDILEEKVEKLNNWKSPIQDEYIEKFLGVEFYSDAFEKNRRYLVDPGENLQKSVVVDISGGGLRFVANFSYEEGNTIYCSYRLPGNANDKEYEMLCNVLKVTELESRPGLFEHRIQYIYIDENSREDIIHFIFEEERKIRKKQT